MDVFFFFWATWGYIFSGATWVARHFLRGYYMDVFFSFSGLHGLHGCFCQAIPFDPLWETLDFGGLHLKTQGDGWEPPR